MAYSCVLPDLKKKRHQSCKCIEILHGKGTIISGWSQKRRFFCRFCILGRWNSHSLFVITFLGNKNAPIDSSFLFPREHVAFVRLMSLHRKRQVNHFLPSQCFFQYTGGRSQRNSQEQIFRCFVYLQARVNRFLDIAEFAFDCATPVEDAGAPLHDVHLLRPVAATTAHQITAVHTDGSIVALASPRAGDP